MSVIYLLSSLPTLQLDAPAPITTEAFVAACRDQLSAADAAAAEALLTDAACDHPFVTTWRDRDTILRNAAAYQRARLAGTDASRWLRPEQGCDTRIGNLVEDAFDEKDPLQREKALDRIRWLVAEELQVRSGPAQCEERLCLCHQTRDCRPLDSSDTRTRPGRL
ncbi:MAG: hypothetical protein ACOX7Q_08600 [Kiritimatiellia bacterium]